MKAKTFDCAEIVNRAIVEETINGGNMSKEVAVKKDIGTEHDLSNIERLLMQGDLAKLDANERVMYYNTVCQSMGLNPYTRPFDYISLNGKLTLYAKKDATEQLRQVKKISIVSLEGRIVDDLYIVVAKASTPDGRMDQSTGAVSIGNLRGEQKANAIMKAETKAKRRVTLSISGMGWTDESEIESIPNAQHVNVSIETGEIIQHQNLQIANQSEEKLPEKVTLFQAEELRLLNSTATQEGQEKVAKTFEARGIKGFKDLPVTAYQPFKDILLKAQMTAVSEQEAVDE